MADDDVRWKYGVPPAGNANFAWLQHMVHHLAPNGSLPQELGHASIGTDDDETIDKIISTAKNPCLTIRLDWPTNKKPPARSLVEVSINRSRAQQQVKIRH